jgi:hypothetical protein
MDFEETFQDAARCAETGINRALRSLRHRLVEHEDDLTGVLKGNLDAELDGQIGGLTWRCKILNHRRGVAAEESEFGADMLFHVKFDTPTESYSKGVLVQAKRSNAGLLTCISFDLI